MTGRWTSFFRARFASFHLTPFFLPSSSVSLSYFILAVPMHECFPKHSCMGSARMGSNYEFLISCSHTEWYLLFLRGEIILGLAEASPITNNYRRSAFTFKISLCPVSQILNISAKCNPHRLHSSSIQTITTISHLKRAQVIHQIVLREK